MENYFLSPDGDQWKLQKQDSKRAIKRFETKQEGMQESTQYVRDHGGSLKIQKQDGTFQEERTYPRSADPRKTEG